MGNKEASLIRKDIKNYEDSNNILNKSIKRMQKDVENNNKEISSLKTKLKGIK